MTTLRPARKSLLQRRDVARAERDVAGRCIVERMLGARRFRDREHRGFTGEKAERDLTRRSAMRLGDPRQPVAALALGRWKIVGTERRIGDDGNAMLLAPWNHRMLDGPRLQMIEHLIAGDLALA